MRKKLDSSVHNPLFWDVWDILMAEMLFYRADESHSFIKVLVQEKDVPEIACFVLWMRVWKACGCEYEAVDCELDN